MTRVIVLLLCISPHAYAQALGAASAIKGISVGAKAIFGGVDIGEAMTAREWTDIRGNVVVATYLSFDGEFVHIRRFDDKREGKIRIDDLSAADRIYVLRKNRTPPPRPKPPAEVTKANFLRVRTGMRYSQVTAILGRDCDLVADQRLIGNVNRIYQWEGDSGGIIHVHFMNGKVISKAQAGL